MVDTEGDESTVVDVVAMLASKNLIMPLGPGLFTLIGTETP